MFHYSSLIFELVIATWYTFTNRLEINWYRIWNLTRNYYTHLDKLVLIASNAIRLRYFNHVGSRFESAESCAYTQLENHFRPEFEIKLLHSSFITQLFKYHRNLIFLFFSLQKIQSIPQKKSLCAFVNNKTRNFIEFFSLSRFVQ